MKNKILIFLMLLALILSVGTVCAEDADMELLSDSDADVIGEADADTENQDTLTSSPKTDELATPEDNEVLGDDPVYVKPGKVTNRFYDGVIYKATFYDASGKPLNGAAVFCGIDSAEYGKEIKTDENGVAVIPITGNGNHKLFLYSPLDVNNPVVDNIKVFDVITGGKNINMYYDGGNTYKVRVFDDNGNPVKAGEKVTFNLNGKKYTKKTDSKGYAKLKITSKPGFYYIKATYKDFEVANTVYVKNVVKVYTGSLGKGLSKTTKLKVKFLGKNKKNKVIKIKFNKKTYNGKTNKKGIIIFKLKTPKKLGKYNVVVSYKKEKSYYIYTQSRT